MKKTILAIGIFLSYVAGLPIYFFSSVSELIPTGIKTMSFLLFFFGSLVAFLFGVFLFAADTSTWEGKLKAVWLNLLLLLLTTSLIATGLIWSDIDIVPLGIIDGAILCLIAFLSGHSFEVLLRYNPKKSPKKEIRYNLSY